MSYYRHGDLSFHPESELPEKITPIVHDGTFVLALGEATGHQHLLTAESVDSVSIFRDLLGELMVEVRSPAKISHQEHKTIVLEPGIYRMKQEREMDWFAHSVMRVQD